ncbi:retinol dehydrogenase 12-like protein [Conidiobolus coronatus NRRL 28638]|uniref:Retinol dehydrogenase 12-like protein n=1 Tax=Conidiobolus coronatus (strain ATCC 28846 / CBS 209.66 / NRRL 28638) TaxID=796925 RepID=A0A137P1M9_CONC2|nr:retinol dehydrogenase 12-like protein [Conidiobolus coronatus NRRL 28638]|eukprot:KXN68858.1 retinol dehydrogenase 12-like protein [Conidiobolus coronatus NRRL 28638]
MNSVINTISLCIGEVIKSYTKLIVHPVNLSGKTILITGGNEGIGFETAVQLAKMNAKIIIASRNLQKSQSAVEKIKHLSHNNDIHCRQVDLGSIQSVNEFSEKFKQEFPTLDILINNAGLVCMKYSKTEDDLEKTLQVNHISVTLLTINLLPILLKAEDPKIVFVASVMHNFSKLQLPRDLELPPSSFIGINEYNKSKKMNILTAKVLAKELKNKNIKVVSLHPGYVYSNLGQDNFQSLWSKLISYIFVHPLHTIFARKTDQGAMTSVFCATDSGIISGEYYDSCKIGKPDKQANDEELGRDLWERTLNILKIDKEFVSKL